MAVVSILILVVFVLSALLLMVVVLLQDDQGGGIASMFGGGSSTPFGARTGNVMTRLTAVLATIFLVAAFSMAWLNRTPDVGNVIGRARAEQLRGIERTDWWVEAPAAAAVTPQPVALETGAAPAGDEPVAAESVDEGGEGAPAAAGDDRQ